jgi:hypothetical protein
MNHKSGNDAEQDIGTQFSKNGQIFVSLNAYNLFGKLSENLNRENYEL